MARRHGWRPLVIDWDEPKYKRCWEQASRSETLRVIAPTTCYPHAASLPLRGVSIYEYGPPYRSIRIGANNVDILAVTRKSEEPGLVAPSRFTSVPDSVFGLSRARVYNAVASDLYTQDWRASLVPVRGDDQTLQALRHMTRGMPPLESLYSRMDARDLESLTTR